MQNDVTHAALLWHAAHARRLAGSAEKRRLEKLLKNGGLSAFSPVYTQHSAAARQVTELKRRELALLRITQGLCRPPPISFTYLDRTLTDLIDGQLPGCRKTTHSHCAGMLRHADAGAWLRKGNIRSAESVIKRGGRTSNGGWTKVRTIVRSRKLVRKKTPNASQYRRT